MASLIVVKSEVFNSVLMIGCAFYGDYNFEKLILLFTYNSFDLEPAHDFILIY